MYHGNVSWILLELSMSVVLTGCGATVKQVAATDAEGDVYPFCVKVVQPLNPLAVRVKILGCATTQAAAEEQQAQLRQLYPGAQMAIVQVRK